MTSEKFPVTDRPELHGEENSWSARVKDLAVNKGRFNPDTDIHSLETHGKDGTHYVIGYKPHTKLPIEPECLAIKSGKTAEGDKTLQRFIWDESEGPEHLYSTQLADIDNIINVFEQSGEDDG